MIAAAHREAIFQATGKRVRGGTPARGGDIARAYTLTLADGQKLFYKTAPGGMFPVEARGLEELAKPGVIRVPKVVAVGEDFLVLEVIPFGSKGPGFAQDFGRRFARLHRHQNDCFGFEVDNFCGATPQPNPRVAAGPGVWAAWFWEHRLEHQLRLARDKGRLSVALSRSMARLEPLVPEILADTDEPPCLLHGDLWGGNYLVDPDGEPVLIDPAVYYGHREADLAMTSLFGGFSEAFYRAYDREWPLQAGWRERVDLYQLYHVLNHLNLFGGGYGGQAERMVRGYLR